MKKLFRQELRFKDENGKDFPDWDEKRLEDVLAYEQPTNYIVSSTDYKEFNQIPVLTAGKTFVLGYTNETDGIFKKGLPVIIFDDFTTASRLVDFPFKIKSSAIKILKPKQDTTDIRFVFLSMRRIEFTPTTHKRHYISEYSKSAIPFPSLPEQNKTCLSLKVIRQ